MERKIAKTSIKDDQLNNHDINFRMNYVNYLSFDNYIVLHFQSFNLYSRLVYQFINSKYFKKLHTGLTC